MDLFKTKISFVEYDTKHNIYVYDPKNFDIRQFLTFFKDSTVVVHGHNMFEACFLMETCHRIVVDHTGEEETQVIHAFERH